MTKSYLLKSPIYLLKYPTIKTSNINTALESKIVQIDMYNLQTKLEPLKEQ